MKWQRNLSICLTALLIIVIGLMNTIDVSSAPTSSLSYQLPDISGLAWVADDLFVGVHDAKNSKNSPRVSLLTVPDRSDNLVWTPQSINWPISGGRSSDLESITPIPDTSLFLAAESGGKKGYDRIFKLKYDRGKVTLIETRDWPIKIKNAEAVAVSKIKDQYIFLYAERNDGKPSTEIKWASMTLNPWGWGEFRSVEFSSPLQGNNIRPITDIALDAENNIYIATAFDPDRNDGPFYSAVYRIGAIETDAEDKPYVKLDEQPTPIGEIDGFKVEGIAIEGRGKIFIGTDDENYGGVVRRLPSR